MMNNYNSLSPGRDIGLKRTWQKKAAMLLFFVLFCVVGVRAQVTTNGGSGLSPTYTSLANAITALNSATISSPVVITLTGNETAPAGTGYYITATGTAANTITITGSSSTITAGANGAGGLLDAVFKIVGGDYITISNFTIQENTVANTVTATGATNTMTEAGILLIHASATDGAQNNTIQGNTISLSSVYPNTVGILSTSSSTTSNANPGASTATDATSSAGTNSSNKVYSNTISSVAFGIYFIHPPMTATVIETGNDIGGASLSTGNTITYGNNTASTAPWNRSVAASAGIVIRNGAGNSIRYNTVNTISGLTIASTAIAISSGTAPTGVTYTSTIGNNIITMNNTGTTAMTGIDFGHGISGGNISGNGNNITLNKTAGAADSSALIGIKANYASGTNTLNSNTIVVNQSQTAGANTNAITGINAAGAGTTVQVGSTGNGNTITVKQAVSGTGSYGSGAITYINVNATSATVNVQGNTLNTTGSTIRSTGAVIGVFQDSTVTVLVFIDNNNMTVDRVAASGSITFQSTSGTPSEVKDTITNNIVSFTNLSGTSTATGISSLGGPSGGTANHKTIDGNAISISGTTTGAIIGIATNWSNIGLIRTNNITVNTVSASIIGINAASNAIGQVVSGNTFSLTSSSTAPTTMQAVNLASSGANSVTANIFTALNLTGVITGSPVVSAINVSSGTGANIFSNVINNISAGAAGSTANVIVDGILVSGGTSLNVYKNKIYGLSTLATGTTTVVNGIRLSAGTTNTVYNNLIGELTAPASASVDAIRGISVTSTTASSTNNVYNNSIFLNASSTGANFGTTGIYHAASATATTAVLDLRNNIVINTSTPSGTGVIAALRRSAGTAGMLANYSSNSNRNMLYAGTPSATRLIYTDGKNSAQTLANYTGGVFTAGTVAPRDGLSFSETFTYPTAGNFFTAVTGSSANFLRPVDGITTQAESGGSAIALTSPDYNGVTRTGSAYDVGAWEFAGNSPAPTIALTSATPALTTQCAAANRDLVFNINPVAGTITSAVLNYSHNGVAQGAVTLTNTTGTTYTGTMLAPSVTNATVTWSVTATNSSGITTVFTGTSYSDNPTLGSSVLASTTQAAICSGSSTTLSSELVVDSGSFTLGAGATTSSANPNPFNGGYGGIKSQMLFTAAELQAAGLRAGDIKSFALDFSATGTTYNGFGISVGNTASATFNNTTPSIEGGLTSVYSAASVTPTVGVNTYVFSTPFNWNGTSNIIVSICWSNANTSNTSATLKVDSTTNYATQSYRKDNETAANLCSFTGATGAGTFSYTTAQTRPRSIFNGKGVSTNYTSLLWSNGATTATQTVSPTADTNYSVTYTLAPGCPVVSNTVAVTVSPAPTAPTASGTLTQCGTKVPSAATLTMVDPNGFTTPTFKFYAASTGGTALQSSTSPNYNTSISATTTLYVTVVNPATSCESTRAAVTITVGSALPVTISGNPANACPNTTVTATASGSYPTYTWTVSPNDGTGGFTGTFSGATLSTVPTAGGSYTYTVSNTDGDCTAVNSFTLTVTAPPVIAINPTAATICNGSSVTLTAQTPTIGAGQVTIGTGTDTSTLSTDGTPYRTGNTVGNQFKNQFLIKASELSAAGLAPGAITSLSLDVSGAGGGTLSNLTIRMGHSALAAMTTTYVTGLTQVYSVPTWPATGTLTTGLQTHTFNTPFVWDGTSNLVIEVCAQLATSGSAGTLRGNTTSFVSHILNNPSTTGCSTATSTTSSVRPNILLNGQTTVLGAGSLTYSWNDPASTTGNVLTVSPTGTTTYTVTGVDPVTGCAGTKNVVVTVNPAPTAPTFTGTLTQCGAKVPSAATLTVVDPNAFTTPTFKWYAALAGGTALQSSTSATYNTSVSGTTTLYVSVTNPTSSCESTRSAVTITVTTPPAVTITPASATTFCVGAPVTSVSVTASSANDPNYTYSWTASPSTGSGMSGTVTGATQTLAPTVAGTYVYSVAATDAGTGCLTTQTISVTLVALPVITSVTASPASVCNNGISTLTASFPSTIPNYTLSGATTTYAPITGTALSGAIGDDFAVGNLPIGFPFVYNGVSQTVFAAASNGFIELGSTLTYVDNGTSGWVPSTNALASRANVIAPFWDDNNTTGGSVIYATTGTAPNRVLTVQWTDMHVGGSGSATNPTISVQARLYESNGAIEFTYGPRSGTLSSGASVGISGAVGVYRSISPLNPIANSTVSSSSENTSVVDTNLPSGSRLTLTPPVATNTVVWSPNIDLYTDAAATVAYNGTSSFNTLYSKPVATRTYTARVTNTSGCYTDSAPVTVTQNGVIIDPITGGATSACIGNTSVIDFNTSEGVTWTSSNTSVATINADGIVTLVAPGNTTISAAIVDTVNGCTSNAPNTAVLNVYTPAQVTSSPSAQSVLPYDGVTPTTATYTVATSGSVSAIQWYVSTDNFTFTPITNGGNYSGATTATLTVSNAPVGLNNTYYRAQVIGFGPCTDPQPSGSAILTVADLSVTLQPVMNPASLCGSGDATFTVGFSLEPEAIQWQYSTDGTNFNDVPATLGGITFSGADTTTLSITGLTSANNNWKVQALAGLGETIVTSNPANIAVTPAATVTNPTDKVVCYSGGTSVFTVTAANQTNIQWQYSTVDSANNADWSAVTNGTPAGTTYLNPNGASLSVITSAGTPIPAVAYYYRAAVTAASPCPAIYSENAELTFNNPNVTVNSSATSFCVGGTGVTLTASGATTYSWSPATGLSATTGASVVASPSVTTTYTVVGTTNGCSKSTTYTVVAGNNPVVTATATPAALCLNASSQLLAAVPTQNLKVSAYAFSTSSAPYADLTGATEFPVNGSAGTWTLDEGVSDLQDIGFNFNLGTATFTNFAVDTNGYLVFGSTPTVVNTYNVFTSTNETNVIAFNNRDLHNTNATYSYVVEGTAPNRICKIQAKNFWRYNTSTHLGNAQVWLYETSNKVEIHYGTYAATWTSGTAKVGLKGASTAAADILSVTAATWAGVNSASAGSDTTGITQGTTNQVVSGTVFTFTPPTPITYTYAWTPSTYIAGQTSLANPVATNVADDITYTVTVTSNLGCVTTKTVALDVVGAVTITTQPVGQTVCEGSAASFSVVASGANLSYQWKRNEQPITGNASATTANLVYTAATPADAGNITVLVTSSCGAPQASTAVTLTVNPKPTATAPVAQTYCAGATTTAIPLVGTPSGVRFDITGGAGIGLANQTSVTALPAFTTIAGTATITLTPKANGCTGTAVTFTITVNALPTALTVTPTASTLCPTSAAVALTANGGLVSNQTILGENFDTSAPAWSVVSTGTAPAGTNWLYNTAPFTYDGTVDFTNFTTVNGGKFAMSNADAGSSGLVTNTVLTSPSFSTVGYTNASVNFEHAYKAWSSDTTVKLEISTNGGSTWTQLVDYKGTDVGNSVSNAVTTANASVSLNSYLNQANVKIRYNYVSTWGYYWIIDNVQVVGTKPGNVIWTPTTGLYTDAAGTVNYDGVTPTTTVYAKPTTTTTYQAKVTSGSGCFVTATAAITVNAEYPFYVDSDNDGFGAGSSVNVCATNASTPPAGYSLNNTDCAPTDATKWRTGNFYTDADNDGYYNGDPTTVSVCYGATTPSGYVASIIGTDCNDANAEVNPNHVEVMGNGIDDNCDGTIDEVAPTTALQPSQCGSTLTNIAQAIYANQVPGAQGYRFEVTLGSNVRIYDSATSSFNLMQLPGGAAYATTYSIRVAVKTAPGFWRAYSAACNITTPALPDFTKIIAAQCGITLTSLSNTIYCDQVTSANQYRFEVTNVTNGGTPVTYDSAVNRFNLTNVNGQYATTYSVRVALRFGTTWMDYGTSCNITSPLTPTASNVIPSQCGITISNSWTTIYATQVPEATGYRFEVVNGATTRYFDTPNARFNLHNLAGAAPAPSTAYTIRVAILYNSVYQPFGSPCTITTAAAITRQTATPVSVFAVKAYPNPFADNFRLDINTSSEDRVQLQVYDMIGKLVESREVTVTELTAQEIGSRYSSGVYNVIVTQGENVETLRVIKR